MINVLIADDQELIRQSLQIILNLSDNINVLGAVSNGEQVLRAIRKQEPDVILMDIRMPEMDGVIATKLVKESHPDIKIIILTTFDDDEYVFNAIKYGASGYLLKGTSTDELVEAIEKVYNGTAMINEDIASKVVRLFNQLANQNVIISVDDKDIEELKPNEKEVIALVGRGFSNKEIAEKLFLSNGTIRNMVSTILGKLHLRDRTQLAIWAIQIGLVKV